MQRLAQQVTPHPARRRFGVSPEHADGIAAEADSNEETVLICDVVIGKPYYADHRGAAAIQLNSDFAAEYDSIIAGSGTATQTTTVFSPQQILPRPGLGQAPVELPDPAFRKGAHRIGM